MKFCRSLLLALIILTLGIMVSCKKQVENNVYEMTQFKMDTSMTIKAYGQESEAAVKEAFKRIDEIEQIASININTSDISRINNASGSEFIHVHPEILKIIKTAISYSKLSNGAFDITVGPIVQLWGIGTQNERVPSPEEIKDKLKLVGYEKIKINEVDSSIMLAQKGMVIDLGGIAKGYAADEAARIIISHGIKKATINLGGSSVYAIGEKDNNKPWKIGIQHPRKENGQGFLGVIQVSNSVISTSGDYERFFIKDGIRYHHIIDPLTGYPADSGVISNTIIIKSNSVVDNSMDASMDADALTKVAFVLGSQKGMEFINGIPGVECIIATQDHKIITSPGLVGKLESISEDFKYDAQGR